MKQLLILLILLPGYLIPLHAQNGKKIYADYHGTRYTRLHDGKLGRWSYYANTEKSATGRQSLCYNADLIGANGRHDIAAVAYPAVGLYSALDPDYIEYQILSAKAAGIDGFFIEWGFPEHESDLLLKAMQQVARKYDFEIGVNWCDGWLYYDWITKQVPSIRTRAHKTQHFARSMQYLIDEVFTGPTAPLVKGKPVLYLFGAGIQPEEYEATIPHYPFRIPKGGSFPYIFRRVVEWGKLVEDRYVPAPPGEEAENWSALGMVPSPWIPARIRPMDDNHPLWDKYGTLEDAVAFLSSFGRNWEDNRYPVKTGFVTPGMDNRGCAGWGWSHFYYIPREEGKTYEELWKVNLQHQEQLDMIFIASWSDYTEGHEIEPTLENGDRELRTTLRYASQFKEMPYDTTGIALPPRLLNLRKRTDFLEACGYQTRSVRKELDRIAKTISNGRYQDATGLLEQQNKRITEAESRIRATRYEDPLLYKVVGTDSPQGGILAEEQRIFVHLDPSLRKVLKKEPYEGYITFEYLDKGKDGFRIYSHTRREPKSLFAVVADIRHDNTGEWKKARVKLYRENITFSSERDLWFTGKGEIRNVQLSFETYRLE